MYKEMKIMPQDHEGKPITTGTELYLPVKVVAIEADGSLNCVTGYSGNPVNGVVGSDTHHGQPPSWPAMPA